MRNSKAVLPTLMLLLISGTAQAQQVLTTGTGGGSVTVTVDGYGSFGSNVNGVDMDGNLTTDNAYYTPLGTGNTSGTVYQSGVAIRIGDSGPREFLTSGNLNGSGGFAAPTISGNPTSANSLFSYNGLDFTLQQNVIQLYDSSGTQIGSRLSQTYVIHNTTTQALNFELVRYVDGDLTFDGSYEDGGGRLAGPPETLFETDTATGAVDPTTFVGITADGGNTLTTNRYQMLGYSALLSNIINGDDLTNTIQNDLNGDGFIDNNNGYDVTMALRNTFTLNAGDSDTYTTETLFGEGVPAIVVSTTPAPNALFPMAAGMTLLGGVLARRRKRMSTAA